jgi:hypothetical protein
MTIRGNNNSNVVGHDNTGFVGIRAVEPRSRLHIGADINNNNNAWRPWMEEGLFIGGGTYAGEDAVYLGLKRNEDHNNKS